MSINSNVYAQLKSLSKKIDDLSLRERILLLFTLLFTLIFTWDSIWLQDQLQLRMQHQESIAALNNKISAQQKIERALQTQLAQDPNVREQARLTRYQQEIERLDQLLKTKALEFISPQQMVEVLKNLIATEQGVKLVALESIDPEMPLLAEVSDVDKSLENTTPMVYLHGLEMELAGDYFSILKYIQRLESLSWRFAWAAVAIHLDQYPSNKINIRLQTLSLAEGWIGV